MKFKHGVSLNGIRPEMVLGLMICESVYREHDHEMTVTSLTDGSHSKQSLHYRGLAADLRTRDYKLSLTDLRNALTVALGPEFDVVLEKDHMHIEHDVD